MAGLADAFPVTSSSQLVRRPPFRSRNAESFSCPVLCFSFRKSSRLLQRLRAVRTGSDGGRIRNREAYGEELIRRPIVKELGVAEDEEVEAKRNLSEDGEEDEDWEDKILKETAPLVGFVRMILRTGRYQSGEPLRPDHETTVLEKLLPYHPESEKKIGCGIDYITVGYHPDFESSRCLFIVRTDGELVDLSYWKCIKGLIRKKYPLYADSFILEHFGRRQRSNERY